MRYNLRLFTNTNSVICKIIVGTPLLRCPRTPEDGCPYGYVGGFPSRGRRNASPTKEMVKEIDIYESHRGRKAEPCE